MIPNAPRCDLGMETVLQLSNMGCVLRKVFWIHFHSQKYMSPTPFLIGLFVFFWFPFGQMDLTYFFLFSPCAVFQFGFSGGVCLAGDFIVLEFSCFTLW